MILTLCLALTLTQTTGQWIPVSDAILADLGKTHAKPTDPYATMTAGISVDRTNGDVYLLANNIGICKSTDQGQTFNLVSGTAVTGRFETGWGLNIDPNGRRLMCFSIYGSSGRSDDAGKTWTPSKLGHLDYGAVDWLDTGKSMLAIGHESGGKLLATQDGGTNWQTLGTNFWAVGLFDRKTFLGATETTPGIQRSTDGATWTQVSDEPLAAPVMVTFRGVGYWLGDHGLLESHDKGATWKLIAPTPPGACLGPMFGANSKQMVVGAATGLYQTKDGGKTWTLAAPLAPKIPVLKRGKYGTYGWDPIHNIFYASQMNQPAYKYIAGRG